MRAPVAMNNTARASGRVVGQLPAGRVRVETLTGAGCARCASGRGCGLGLSQGASLELDCDTDGSDMPVGSLVELYPCGAGGHWLPVVATAYGLPTAGLLGGMLLGLAASSSWPELTDSARELAVAVASLFGLAGGVFAWRVVSERLRVTDRQRPHARLARIRGS